MHSAAPEFAASRLGPAAAAERSSTPPVAPRLICIVTGARSGTNHFCSVLSHFTEIDVRHEIFNRTRCQKLRENELAELSRRSGTRFALSCDSAETVSVVRRHPGLVMDCLTELMPPDKRLVCFKVFRTQLSVRQVKHAIVSRPDTIVIFLRRRPIDAFISVRKALQVQRWCDHDTTNLKINIDADDFIGWWGRSSAWFRKVEAACWAMNKPFHRMTYEEDVDLPAGKTLHRVREILASHGVTDLATAPDGTLRDHKRQDQSWDVSERVANWPEFRQRLVDKGFLDKALSPFPTFEPTAWDRFRHRFGLGPRASAAAFRSTELLGSRADA